METLIRIFMSLDLTYGGYVTSALEEKMCHVAVLCLDRKLRWNTFLQVKYKNTTIPDDNQL